MAVTLDWPNRIVEVDSSITDLAVFHAELRAAEDDEVGMLHPIIHTWRALDLGSGAFFYQVDFVNGWQLKFPNAGTYQIIGNLNAPIVSVPGVFVERKTSAAYVTTAIGGSGPSAGDIAAAVAQRTVESGLTIEQMLRVMLSALSGRTSGIGTDTEQYLSRDGDKARITATFDAQGNRTSVAVDGT